LPRNQLQHSENSQSKLTDKCHKLNYKSEDGYSLLTMISNQNFTPMNYEYASESENIEVENVLSWEDICSVLEDGRYWPPSAIATRLETNTKSVEELLKINSSEVFSPSHKSPSTGEKLFVLANKRRRIYELIRPVQLASRAML